MNDITASADMTTTERLDTYIHISTPSCFVIVSMFVPLGYRLQIYKLYRIHLHLKIKTKCVCVYVYV